MKKKTIYYIIVFIAAALVSLANNGNDIYHDAMSVESAQTEERDNTWHVNPDGDVVAKNHKNSDFHIDKYNQSEEDETHIGNIKVHFIDVGQADSILIQTNEETMLIDAGNNADSEEVVEYLKAQGVETLDYVVGTHPHEDHIGGLDAVIMNFDIGKIYMPKVMSTTKTFEDVLKAISDKNLKITTPVAGTSVRLGNASFVILAPNSESYEETNNYSVVIKLIHGDNTFLFTGDAEYVSEKEMIEKGYDLSAKLLKVGHHGSSSSTTEEFLNKVNPKYAVISVGEGNKYGHPHEEVIKRLKDKGIEIYRTDESGTIIATSDGETITIELKSR